MIAGLCTLTVVIIACGSDNQPKVSGEFKTAVAQTTQQAREGSEVFGQFVTRHDTLVPVRRLPDGTLVAEGTPLPLDEVSTVVAAASATEVPATETPTPTRTPEGFTPAPTVAGIGRLAFASYEPIAAAVGAEFSLALTTKDVDRPYQGFQWNIYAANSVEVLREEPVAASGLDICTGINEVAPNQHYGGCLKIGDQIKTVYQGRLTTVIFRCTTPGVAQIRLLNALEGGPFKSTLIDYTGGEFGSTDTTAVSVTCT